MNFEDMAPELQERLKAAKDEQELLAIVAAEGLDLSSDELRGISGGARPFGGGKPSVDPAPYCYANCEEDNDTICWGHNDN